MKKIITAVLAFALILVCAPAAVAIDSATELMNLCYFDSACATKVKSFVKVLGGQDAEFSTGKTVALQEATAASACMGSLTCNGASDVVTSTTCATTGSRIFLTRTSLDADTTGDFYVKSLSNGVSFTVACEASDTATLNWIIFHESP